MIKTKFFVLLLFVMLYSTVSAQNLKVELKDKRESLPYGYIYVNGKIKAVSDSTGIALLKANELKIGDTISATYVGYKPKWQIYNAKMAKNQQCELLLETDIYNLEDVVVIGVKDAAKLFAKKVVSSYMVRNGVLTADFEAQIEPTGGKVSHFSGRIAKRNEVDSKKFEYRERYGFFHHPTQLTTNSDTLSKSKILNLLLDESMNASYQIAVFSSFYYRKTNGEDLVYNYVGKSGDLIIFRVIDKRYSKYVKHFLGLPNERDVHFPQLLYVDEKTGHIVKYEMDFITDVEGEVASRKVRAEYAHYKIKGTNRFIPTQVSYTASTGKFANRVAEIKNIVFKPE